MSPNKKVIPRIFMKIVALKIHGLCEKRDVKTLDIAEVKRGVSRMMRRREDMWWKELISIWSEEKIVKIIGEGKLRVLDMNSLTDRIIETDWLPLPKPGEAVKASRKPQVEKRGVKKKK